MVKIERKKCPNCKKSNPAFKSICSKCGYVFTDLETVAISGKKIITTTFIDSGIHRRAKIYAAEHNTSLSRIMEESLTERLEQKV